ESKLDAVLDPVDAAGLTHAEPGRHDAADQHRGDTDDDGPQHGDVLPPRQDQPGQHAENRAADDRPQNRTEHDAPPGLPAVALVATAGGVRSWPTRTRLGDLANGHPLGVRFRLAVRITSALSCADPAAGSRRMST